MARSARTRLFLATLALAMVALSLSARPVAAQDDVHALPQGTPAAEHAVAHAEHEQGQLLAPLKQGLPAMIASFLVFGVVYMVLKAKAWPLIAKGLDDRASKIRSEIEAAELAQQQAREALQQYGKSLAQARAEAQKMLDDAKLQQQAISADLKAKADVELGAMRERAKRDIDAAKRSAIAEIYTEASTMATAIAAKILQREIRPQDQQRLVDESLAQFQSVHNN